MGHEHRLIRRMLVAVVLAGLTFSAPARAAGPDFAHNDNLAGYAPIAVAAGAPQAHPIVVASPGDKTFSPEGLATAQAYSDAHGGFALLIWQGGQLKYERYAPGHDADTRFETFSMHKSVLGLVYGAALRDGVIRSLDDPAGRYLPEWRDDARGAITLRQILGMQSGLRAYGQGEAGGAQLASGDQATQAALALPLEVPPGTVFQYNNANSQIAGAILNRALKAAGKGDYPAYVSKVLLTPLGAGDAHLWLEHEGGDPRFFAHFQVRARDWLRIGMLIDHGGRVGHRQVLPASWIRTATSAQGVNPNYGLQIWIGSPWRPLRAYSAANPLKVPHAQPYLADDLVFFDGFGGQRVYVVPSRDLVIVRIGLPEVAFDDSVIPNAVMGAMTRVNAASASR